jgi:hypothetical protein
MTSYLAVQMLLMLFIDPIIRTDDHVVHTPKDSVLHTKNGSHTE